MHNNGRMKIGFDKGQPHEQVAAGILRSVRKTRTETVSLGASWILRHESGFCRPPRRMMDSGVRQLYASDSERMNAVGIAAPKSQILNRWETSSAVGHDSLLLFSTSAVTRAVDACNKRYDGRARICPQRIEDKSMCGIAGILNVGEARPCRAAGRSGPGRRHRPTGAQDEEGCLELRV